MRIRTMLRRTTQWRKIGKCVEGAIEGGGRLVESVKRNYRKKMSIRVNRDPNYDENGRTNLLIEWGSRMFREGGCEGWVVGIATEARRMNPLTM